MTTYDTIMADDIDDTSIVTKAYRYAGFWMRFWAYITDILIITSIQGIVVRSFLSNEVQEMTVFGLWSSAILLSTLVYYAYFVCMTKVFQATLGKMIFGLKVVRVDGNTITWLDLLFREVVGRFIYNVAFGFKLLYLIIAFTKEKQGIHDMIGNTRVIHIDE